jgi:hypothetical protein
MLVPNTNTKARCTGDDESAPARPQDQGLDPSTLHSSRREDMSIDGPEFAATPGVAARGPKTGAADLLTYLGKKKKKNSRRTLSHI